MNKDVVTIARYCECDPAHISRILSGKSKPSVDLAAKMASYYEITIGDLLLKLHIVEST